MHFIIHIAIIFVSSRFIWQFSRFLKVILINWSPCCWDLKACEVLVFQAAPTTVFRSNTKFVSNWVSVRRFQLGMLGMIQSKTLIFLYVKVKKKCKTFYIRLLVIPKKALTDTGLAPYETSVRHPSPTEFSILDRNMFMRKYRALSVVLWAWNQINFCGSLFQRLYNRALNSFIIRNSALFCSSREPVCFVVRLHGQVTCFLSNWLLNCFLLLLITEYLV